MNTYTPVGVKDGALNPLAHNAVRALAAEVAASHVSFRGRQVSYPSYWPHSYWQSDPANDVWAKALARPSNVGFVIVNPNSGPDTVVSEDWVIQSRIAAESGAACLGYVSTNYANAGPAREVGSRSHDVILAEIARHVDWYKVRGVFLDEVSNGRSTEQAQDHVWYAELVAKIRTAYGPGFVVVGNAGAVTTQDYPAIFDVVVTFESDAARYLSATVSELHPAVFRHQPAGKFWHMVHDVVSVDQARAVLERAATMNVGHIYLTDDTNAHEPPALWGNPYDALPVPWLLDLQLDWAERDGRLPVPVVSSSEDTVGSPLLGRAELDTSFQIKQGAPDIRADLQAALDDASHGSSRSYWSVLEVNGTTVELRPGIYRLSSRGDGAPSVVVPRGVELRTDKANLQAQYPTTPTTNWSAILVHSHGGLTVGKIKPLGTAPDAAHVYDGIRSYMQDNRNVVQGVGGAGIISGFQGAGYRSLGSYVVWLQNLRIAFCSHGIVHGHSGGLVTDGVGAYAVPSGHSENVSATRRPTDMWVQNVNLESIRGNNIVVGSPGTKELPNSVTGAADSVTGGNLHLEHVIAEGSPARFLRARELSEIIFDDVHLEEVGAPGGPMIDLDVIYGFIRVSSMRINTSQKRAVKDLAGASVVSNPNKIWQLGSYQQFIHDALYFQNSGSDIAFSGAESWAGAWTGAVRDIRGIAPDKANTGKLLAAPMLPSDNFTGRATNVATTVV